MQTFFQRNSKKGVNLYKEGELWLSKEGLHYHKRISKNIYIKYFTQLKTKIHINYKFSLHMNNYITFNNRYHIIYLS